jgi:hypothetical protein
MVALIALAATLLIVTAVAFAKDTFPSGTYSGTVTAQDYGVTPFPMSLKVVGKKRAKEKKITGLTIGPIQMVCLAAGTQASESVTLAALTGFPAIKSSGFLQATFLYENGGWQHVALDTTQTADPQVELLMVVNGGKHPTFVGNGGANPGMDIVVKANVTGSTATVAQDGTSTCNIDNSNPTLTLTH